MSKMKKIVLFGGLLLFFAVVAVGGIEMTSQPGFCKSCHSMEAVAYDTWDKSSHKEVDCLTCHKEPGIIGLLEVKIGGLRQVWKTVTGTTPEKIVAEVPNSRCTQCHEQIPDPKIKPKKELLSDKVVFDHDKHLKADVHCTDCHARVVHGEKDLTPSEIKANCIECHTKKSVKVEKCSDCHKPYHKGNYQVTHSADVKKSTTECMDCHAKADWAEGIPGVGKNFCDNCHQVPMPHKAPFVKTHGVEYEKNKESCSQCHSQNSIKTGSKATSCIGCHKVEIPHKEGFKENHYQSYKKNPASCTLCHNATSEKAGYKAQNCSTCHSKVDIHEVNWKAKHDTESKKANATCTNCHNSTNTLGFKTVSCKNCHSRANVHSSNWMGKHYAESKKAGANCTSCHSSKGKALGFKVKTCYECHNQGHKAGFIKVHEVKYKGRQINCNNCHKVGGVAKTCNSCHKVNMPHPASWATNHGSTAAKNISSCNYCHSSKNPVNPKASYAKSNYCSSCHQTNYKHSADWSFEHMSVTNINSCKVCHVPTSPQCTACHTAKW